MPAETASRWTGHEADLAEAIDGPGRPSGDEAPRVGRGRGKGGRLAPSAPVEPAAWYGDRAGPRSRAGSGRATSAEMLAEGRHLGVTLAALGWTGSSPLGV
jgi:hypothetical protein